MTDFETFKYLGIALAIGLLIGLERGWETREYAEGKRVAGLRTYGLISLTGGVLALVAGTTGVLVLGFGFVGLAVILATAYMRRSHERDDIGITSVIAALLAFTLGAITLRGYAGPAVTVAVVASILLDFKPTLHDWVAKLDKLELRATLKLALISGAILPLLPNKGYGPWGALNPYEIWWMVVLIAALSYLGYFANKIAGSRLGPIITGLFGGLASSTAVTLNLSRIAREQPEMSHVLAAGILGACATMFPRVLIIAGIINRELLWSLALPLVVMSVFAYSGAYLFWRRSSDDRPPATIGLKNPFQFVTAIQFGALLALIMILTRVAQDYAGTSGVYLVAVASGIGDVDAITLSLARMSGASLDPVNASIAILIAATVNSAVKSAMALTIAGLKTGLFVLSVMTVASVLGWLSVLIV